MKCYNCGAELTDDTKFCSYCGVNVEGEAVDLVRPKTDANKITMLQEEPVGESLYRNSTPKVSIGDKIKEKLLYFWNGLDSFFKISTVSIAVLAILLIVSICAGKGLAIFFSVLQLAGVVVAILMHKGVIKPEQKRQWIKYLVLVITILFTALNIMSYSWEQDNRPSDTLMQNTTDYQTPGITEAPVIKTTVDAPCSSEDCIGKDYSNIRSDFNNAGFERVLVEKVEDLLSSDADRVGSVVSVTIGGKTEFTQGQEFDKEEEVVILYHAFAKYTVTLHIDFIPNIIFSKYDVDLLVNGVDKGTLEHGKNKDFEFSLDPGEYTMTFESADSSSVKGEVSFTVDYNVDASYKISCYSDKVSVETLYVERKTKLADGEVKIDVSASEYNYKNYREVALALETLGFTNIKYEILYDIVFGWTDEGEVDSVSIARNKDFKRGEIFSKDAEIIITYHMPENANPTNITMPKCSSDYNNMNYLDAEQAFKDLGFTNIKLEKDTIESAYYTDGAVYSVEIDGWTFDEGDTFKPDDKITVKYYVVVEPEVVESITVDNNAEFATLMGITDHTDAATIRAFTNSHIGDVIEFDGCIVLMMNHKNYKTRFDVCMASGNYNANRVYGPLFAFKDENFYDMNVSGTDTVSQGMNFRIMAEIKGYSAEGAYILLEPVSLKIR
ncbi:MAG: DUF4839 domain-containing protein [Eubacteriales bacterium]